jgi:hypothetical protein
MKMANYEGTLNADSREDNDTGGTIDMNGAFNTNSFELNTFITFTSDDLALAGYMNEFAENFKLGDIVDGRGGDDHIIFDDAVAPNLACDGWGDDSVLGSNTADYVWLEGGSNTLQLLGGNDIVRIDELSSADEFFIFGAAETSFVSLGAGADTVWVADIPRQGFLFNDGRVVVTDFDPNVDAVVWEANVIDSFLAGDIEITQNPEGFNGYTSFEWDDGGEILINGTFAEIVSASHFPNLDTQAFCFSDYPLLP